MPERYDPADEEPFPVDQVTLDLLWDAIYPGPEAERSSMGDLLALLSEMHYGPDGPGHYEDGVEVIETPSWHVHAVIAALITEVRRYRAADTWALPPEPGPDKPFTDAELDAGCKAVHELEDMTADRHLSVRHEVAAALWAVLPAHDARIRAQAQEDAARALRDQARRERDGTVDQVVLLHAAEIVREVAGATEPEVPDGS
jgi:hypothetical protein